MTRQRSQIEIYQLSLVDNVSIVNQGTDLILSNPRNSAGNSDGLRLTRPSTAIKAALKILTQSSLTEKQLISSVITESTVNPEPVRYLISLLKKRGWLNYTLNGIATLKPFSPRLQFDIRASLNGSSSSLATAYYQFSRFAWLRREGKRAIIESSLGYGQVILHCAAAAALTAALAKPQRQIDLADLNLFEQQKQISGFLNMLLSIKAVFPTDKDGTPVSKDEDSKPELVQWEFHDLLFYSRSRDGRHNNSGSKFPFYGKITPLPGVKTAMSEKCFPLAGTPKQLNESRLEPKSLSLDFFEVLNTRRSIRQPGESPVSAHQLGLLLFHSARIQTELPADEKTGHLYEASLRPCSSGGAIHELEYYLTISRCDGLDSGFYHYNPLEHKLEYLGPLNEPRKRLLLNARQAAGGENFDILITLAARFQRTFWKYRTLGYSLILKNVGAVFQQLYLVATALNLAPCALGNGDSEIFAAASGLNYYQEGSVGEFIISGR